MASMTQKVRNYIFEQHQQEAQQKADRQKFEDDLKEERLRLDRERFDLEKQARQIQMEKAQLEVNRLKAQADLVSKINAQEELMIKSLPDISNNSPDLEGELAKLRMKIPDVPATAWEEATKHKYEANKNYLSAKVKADEFKRAQDEAVRLDKVAKENKLSPTEIRAQTLPGTSVKYANPKETTSVKPMERAKLAGALAEADSATAGVESAYKAYVAKNASDAQKGIKVAAPDSMDTWLENNAEHGKVYRAAQDKKVGIKKIMESLPPEVPIVPKAPESKAETPQYTAKDVAIDDLVTEDPEKHIFSTRPKSGKAADYPNAPVVSTDAEEEALPWGQVYLFKGDSEKPQVAWKNPEKFKSTPPADSERPAMLPKDY